MLLSLQAWGVMELQAGDLEAARRLFQEGVWADPGNRDVVYIFHAWGTLEMRSGNHALARELYKSALRLDPRSETTWATWIVVRAWRRQPAAPVIAVFVLPPACWFENDTSCNAELIVRLSGP